MSSRQKGMTLVEVLVGIGILAVLIFASVSLTTSALQTTRLNLDRQFATEKAISMLEELKALAQNAAAGNNVVVLDQYDDGSNYQDVLTTQAGALPADPISGNMMGPVGWMYQRQVQVQTIPGQSAAGVRLVRVSVFRNDLAGRHLLAEVSSVIRTLSSNLPQSQVYDVYAIAIENVPGWWVYTSTLKPFVQNAINNLQARNPGLNFRIHWITELAYGRDQEYRPYVNNATDSTADINWVYFYPGTMPVNGALNPPGLDAYYPPGNFGAHIYSNPDPMNPNTPVDVNSTTSSPAVSVPYALADQYNHSMRYYDSKAVNNARIAAGLDTEPTWRILLDDMVMNPTKYTNAILINLHGELFPFPPIRNYSDPAKAPDTTVTADNLQYVRAVTHPEFLVYGSTPDPNIQCYNLPAGQPCVNYRVYSYEAPSGSSSFATGVLPPTEPITVTFPGIDLTGVNTLSVTRIEGGTAQTPATTYQVSNAVGALPGATNRMYATVSLVNVAGVPNTLVKLYNSPLRAPQCTVAICGVANNMGLPTANYLYNQQYIPAPMENFAQNAAQTPFGLNLASNVAGGKNTARWIIGVNIPRLQNVLNSSGISAVGGIPACPAPCSNTALAVDTRIGEVPAGSLPTTGTMWPVRNQPPNLSRTYTWVGSDLWLYGDGTDTNPPHLPMSERFQFIGDPRHCPYADLKMPHSNAGTTWPASNISTRLGMGYNRYFDDFEDSSGNQSGSWPGWTYTVSGTQYGVKNNGNLTDDGWVTGGGQIEIDIQRAFQILRTSLTASRAIYTTMTGYSYYYIGIGNEMGYDSANGFPNSIPVSVKPFTGASGTTTEQSIINGTGLTQGLGVKYIRSNGPVGAFANYWWAMSWLGELYPDGAYLGANGYAANGNLPTGTLATNYKRVIRSFLVGTAPLSGGNFTLPTGTTFNGVTATGGGNSGDNAVHRTNTGGSTDLFWTGTTTSTFHHLYDDGDTANLVSQGLDIASATTGYNFPLLNPIPAARPFSLTYNNTGWNPDGFAQTVYGNPFPTSQQAMYYQSVGQSPIPGSALESLRDPTTNKTAFIVVNGLSPAGQAGSNFIAGWSFVSLIHSFFQAGLYPVAGTETGCAGCTFRVTQLPRVTITSPNFASNLNNPASINIQWQISWTRWDGNKYTPAYSGTFTEAAPVSYQVMYSADNGATWKWCDTSIPGTPSPGVRNPAALITATNYNWNTSSLPRPGNYLIRVEAYRQNFSLHYSYHQYRAFIW